MKRNCIFLIAVICLAGITVFSLWKVWQIWDEYRKGANSYTEIEQFISVPPVTPNADDTIKKRAAAETDEVDTTVWPAVDFYTLQSINPDIVGWILIEGTEINYPIVQGTDNSYYLSHLFNGEQNSSGCVFLDNRNSPDFSDTNSVVYGHHMKNGTMFSGLDNFKHQSYYDEHRIAYLLTPEKNFKVEFFAGYVANVEDDAWNMNFTASGFEDWCARVIVKSCFAGDIIPSSNDRIITLTTCSYEFKNARFVLHGVVR